MRERFRNRDSTVLLLPGMTMNSTIMPDFGVPAISFDFNALSADGFGLSGLETSSMDTYVRLLDSALEHEEAWRNRPRIVVGHSFGGMLALTWLLAHVEEDSAPIDGLILVAASAGPLFDRVRLRLGSIGGHDWRVGLKGPLTFWNRPTVTRFVKSLTPGFRRDIGHVDFGSLTWRSDFAMDLAGWRNTDWRAMRNYRLALQGFDIRDRLHQITVPTIVLQGTRDLLFSVDVAQDLAAGLPNAELRIVEGAGHGLPLTHGEEVVRAVSEMLSVGCRVQIED